jgi:hypothetical protein
MKASGLLLVLEADHEVIGIPHDDHVALCMFLPPPMDPHVQGIVQVDVGKQRTDAAPLRGTFIRLSPFSIFEHSCLQPLLDVPYYTPVPYPERLGATINASSDTPDDHRAACQRGNSMSIDHDEVARQHQTIGAREMANPQERTPHPDAQWRG